MKSLGKQIVAEKELLKKCDARQQRDNQASAPAIIQSGEHNRKVIQTWKDVIPARILERREMLQSCDCSENQKKTRSSPPRTPSILMLPMKVSQKPVEEL